MKSISQSIISLWFGEQQTDTLIQFKWISLKMYEQITLPIQIDVYMCVSSKICYLSLIIRWQIELLSINAISICL